MTRKRRSYSPLYWVIAFFVAVAVIGSISAYTMSQTTQACTVSDKDRATNSDGNSSYRVYTDCGVFKVEDNIFFLRLNSADAYAELKTGESYKLRTIGWRVGLLSMFPNILEATPTK